jgi:phosphatidylethanolamine N-methyltransferase
MSIMETLVQPHLWGLPQFIAAAIALFQLLTLLLPLPHWYYLAAFLFWRFGYNAGLGFILRAQSHSHAFTRLYASISSQFPSLDRVFGKVMGPQYDPQAYPVAFRAWLAYRWLVDVILGNDFVSYAILCVVSFEAPPTLGLVELLQYALGLALCVFNLWAKYDAHRVLGDFAWYWGDFFFLVDKDLVFDGIFQMFPHPMYTVGYAFFYGMSLLTRSYTMLFVSLFAHLFQLCFLAFIENPHIEKTYNTLQMDDTLSETNNESEEENRKSSPIIFFRIDLAEAADALLLVLIGYNMLFYVIDLPVWFYILHVVLWRLLHDVGLGFLLHKQSQQPFLSFGSWKRLYNASLTVNYVAFFVAAYKLYSYPADWDVSSYLAKQLIGLALVGLNVWCSYSTYCTLGDFGWFYGDFFATEVSRGLQYSGIYRFVNNPETVMGMAGFYGLALLSHSWVIGALAAFSHVCQVLFVKLVERPHMERMYGAGAVREKGGFNEALELKRKELVRSWEETKMRLRVVHGIDVDRVQQAVDEIEHAIKKNTRQVLRRIHSPIRNQRNGSPTTSSPVRAASSQHHPSSGGHSSSSSSSNKKDQ